MFIYIYSSNSPLFNAFTGEGGGKQSIIICILMQKYTALEYNKYGWSEIGSNLFNQ